MNDKFSDEQIKDFWQEQATAHGISPNASWSDTAVIEMEIKQILSLLDEGDSVLDVGCANGYSALNLAQQKKMRIRGVDYIPEMIKHANLALSEMPLEIQKSVDFQVGDITALKEDDASYQKVVVIRVLINLGEWTKQSEGIKQCARVLKPGGRLLMSEATLQGWNKMNLFRGEWNLPEIPMPSFNEYLDEEKVIETAAGASLRLIEIRNFASTYFVGTRVLKPLLAKSLNADIDVACPDMEWNRFFSLLPACGDYGTQKLFVFEKSSN